MEEIEIHYERVVDDFIDQFRWKGNIVSYNKFLIGYSFFEIGSNLGFEAPTFKLIEFMQAAKVQSKTAEENQNVIKIKNFLEMKRKEQNSNCLK